MFRDRFLKKLFFVALFLILGAQPMMSGLGQLNPNNFLAPKPHPIVTEARRQHIVFGDRTGGGHLHGLRKPCKSEFPADWTPDDIVAAAEKTAANDNLSWEKQRNGYETAETIENKVRIRVVVNRDKNEIVTAYPLSTPRNPCPAAANDNGN